MSDEDVVDRQSGEKESAGGQQAVGLLLRKAMVGVVALLLVVGVFGLGKYLRWFGKPGYEHMQEVEADAHIVLPMGHSDRTLGYSVVIASEGATAVDLWLVPQEAFYVLLNEKPGASLTQIIKLADREWTVSAPVEESLEVLLDAPHVLVVHNPDTVARELRITIQQLPDTSGK